MNGWDIELDGVYLILANPFTFNNIFFCSNFLTRKNVGKDTWPGNRLKGLILCKLLFPLAFEHFSTAEILIMQSYILWLRHWLRHWEHVQVIKKDQKGVSRKVLNESMFVVSRCEIIYLYLHETVFHIMHLFQGWCLATCR